jgi:hypothetical protein
MYNDIYSKEQYAYERNTLLKWLTNSISGKRSIRFFHENEFKKIVIYGVRGFGELFYQEMQDSDIEIVCFADRDFGNYPHGINGIPVFSVDELHLKSFDAVVVTPTFYFKEILSTLSNHNIDLDKIVSLNMVVSY